MHWKFCDNACKSNNIAFHSRCGSPTHLRDIYRSVKCVPPFMTSSTKTTQTVSASYQLYTHISESERLLLSDVSTKALQASEDSHPDDRRYKKTNIIFGDDALFDYISRTILATFTDKQLLDMGENFTEYVCEMVENVTYLVGGITRARNFDDIMMTVIAVTRFITKKSFGRSIRDLFAKIVGEASVQAGSFDDIRSILNNYDAVKTSPIVEKVRRLCALALSSVFLSSSGITAKIADLVHVYGEAAQQLLAEVDFVTGLIDLVTFIIERLAQCWYQKSLKPFFHSSRSYGRWANAAYTVIEQSQLMHDPEAHGLTYHGFLSDLEKCIEEGLEIQRFSKAADKKDVVLSVLSKLRIVRGEFVTRKAASEERRAPFCMLVAGGTHVGKSSFTRVFFGHFGKMFHLPVGSEYIYPRSFADPFWSNFRTQMWAIHLDDVAYVNPNKGTEDPSLNEILQVCNNVAWCPPQADLADKGKTPLRAECVVGTTNTTHLNAQYWFSNPVAVRRRFPYVATIKPKPQYAKDDAPDMLDPSKVPVPDAGSYPDVWVIQLHKITVHTIDDNGGQDTKMTLMNTFTSIYDFFALMSGIIRDYRREQGHAAANDANMASVKLCPMCDLPRNHCMCAMLDGSESSVSSLPDGLAPDASPPVISYTQEPSVVENLYSGFASTAAGLAAWTTFSHAHDASAAVKRALRTYTREVGVKYITDLGANLVRDLYKNKALRMALFALGTIGAGYASYRLYQSMKEPIPQSKELSINTFGVTPPATGDEKENFYHQKNDYRASLVVSDQTKSWKTLEWTEICKKFSNSVVAVRTYRKVGDELKSGEGRAVCVGGRLYVTTSHILPPTECILEVIRERHVNGLTTNVRRHLDPASVLRMPDRELVFFQLLDSFDCKDITPFLSDPTFTTTSPGALISRDLNGESDIMQLKHTKNIGPTPVHQLAGSPDLVLWNYTTPKESRVGMCGSLLTVRSPTGPVVVGLHLLGNGSACSSVALTRDDVEVARKHFFPIFSPGAPMLESRERVVGVTPLHEKSVFRFIGHGQGRVFGKLTLPHIQPKTSVCPTIFRDEAVKHGFVVETGAPVMKGKKLWRQAVLPIVEQEFLFKESVIEKCANAYAEECYAGLSDSDRKELSTPLSLMAAINGIPGRKYVDSVNRSSSAGFPWMKTKKSVSISLPADDIWQDPITFNSEVIERANEMLERYKRGELVAPVFTAHAKDEPLPFAKIESEKTRIMNGAPLDWSILVRMVYLPMVRVIQNNKFLFESMPGAVAQSVEWDDIYKFITAFGEDKMVAGDYGKFDKKMSAVLILWAFYALITIAKKCGADPTTILVMWGVALDISCSFCNFNGDLVQFLGSNPSGHPLTVILNCVVNCLYMRYCYHELNPEKEVTSFREFVHLITYGDDNEFGTSRPWFNHTAISKLLADLGVEYTMADKMADSVPFLHVSDTSFLKRGWRYEPELNAVVCPIVHATLDKMMTTWVPSTELSPYAQGEEIIRNVGVEYFWYGREVFEEKQKVLRAIFAATIPSEYETPVTFQTWDALILKWKMSSGIELGAAEGEASACAE